MIKSIMLWKPYALEKPEPEVVISYKDTNFSIPYTLMHYLQGWLVMGQQGSFAPKDAACNLNLGIDYLLNEMWKDCNSVTKEEIEQYQRLGINVDSCNPPLPEDYRDK